jgi:hypothetical protein
MPKTYVKQSGVWKDAKIFVKQSGVWKTVQNGYVKQAGVWKTFFINRFPITITIPASTANYTLNTAKVPGYVAGLTDLVVNINSGVVVYSNSVGSPAFFVDSSWASGDTITINNSGVILGKGGNGGNASWPYVSNGTGGGLALSVQRLIYLNNMNRIAGGGGGGGSGSYNPQGAPGGAGGGGIGLGSGGSGIYDAGAGGNGTLTTFGAGGAGGAAYIPPSESSSGYYTYAGAGGAGGNYGSNGSNGLGGDSPWTNPGVGGGAGAAISGNSNIYWLAYGTRNGAIT